MPATRSLVGVTADLRCPLEMRGTVARLPGTENA